ncbi:MAG TPA: hypothetical protein VEU73_15495 [Gemmatimonadales bacterium]|nr:hypothetical protein [Gemmatimonadales bacterium]
MRAFITVVALSLAVAVNRPRGLPQPACGTTAQRLIDDYLAAIGGYAAVEHIHTRRMRGAYDEGPLHATTDIAWARPATRRVNVHAPGFEYAEGFDGSTWEYNFATHVLTRDSGAAADAGRRGAEFDESFIDARAKGHHVELVGLDTLDQRETCALRVTLADGWEKEYYFDPRTYLIVAVRKAMPVHATGPAVISLSYYSDWRRVSGVLTPHTFIERERGSGRTMNILHWDLIELNPVLTPTALAVPSVTH